MYGQNKVSQEDDFKCAFEHANTELTIASYGLQQDASRNESGLLHFMHRCEHMEHLLRGYDKDAHLLRYYHWLRNYMGYQIRVHSTTPSYQDLCLAKLHESEQAIVDYCRSMNAEDTVVPLLYPI